MGGKKRARVTSTTTITTTTTTTTRATGAAVAATKTRSKNKKEIFCEDVSDINNNNLPWKKLNETLDDDKRHINTNHYDDDNSANNAASELYEVDDTISNSSKHDSSGVGILFGIEVLDGNEYEVRKVNDDDDDGGGGTVTQLVSTSTTTTTNSNKDPPPSPSAAAAAAVDEAPSVAVPSLDVPEEEEEKKKGKTADLRTEGIEESKEQSKESKRKLRRSQARRRKRQKLAKNRQTNNNNKQDPSHQQSSSSSSDKTSSPQAQNSSPEQQQEEDSKSIIISTQTNLSSPKELQKDQLPKQSTPTSSHSNHQQQQHRQEDEDDNNSNKDDTLQTEFNTTEESSITTLQTSWSIHTGGIYLHPILCKSLYQRQFHKPTPIQSLTLPASILGRRDVVGAAPTGSGKTFAYLIPILQYLLEQHYSNTTPTSEQDEDDTFVSNPNSQQQKRRRRLEIHDPLTALILCPTRELAMQVYQEIQFLSNTYIDSGILVGGLADVKQKRILNIRKPPILVATPGRLWELMSSEEHDHLNNLTKLRYLVIDEADRMIRQGSFPQLTQIIQQVDRANPMMTNNNQDEDEDDDEDDENEDHLHSLMGVPGEAKVTMLNDRIMNMIENEDDDEGKLDSGLPSTSSGDDDNHNDNDNHNDYDNHNDNEEDNADEEGNDDDEENNDHEEENNDNDDINIKENQTFVHRQTFVYSATLTLPPSSHWSLKSSKNNNKQKNKRFTTMEEEGGAIAEILDKAGARGRTKIVDLSRESASSSKIKSHTKNPTNSSSSTSTSTSLSKTNIKQVLPPGLSLYEIRCTKLHKDSHLYAYLTTSIQGSSGPCLIFCNSIAGVRRVSDMLRILGLSVRTLHAQMAQKARLSSLESLRDPKSRAIVVASDVAARGLDIPSVASVIHYDVARAVDTFIHRAGRTARGMGENAIGSSISLVAPIEDHDHIKICREVLGNNSNNNKMKKKGLDEFIIDSKLLSLAQERVSLATKIVSCDEIESKTKKKNKWFEDAAKEAGLDLDDDLIDGGLSDGTNRDRHRLVEAHQARILLQKLLSIPMRKQTYGKFLSGVGIRKAWDAERTVSPFVVVKQQSKWQLGNDDDDVMKMKKTRRRRKKQK